MLLFPQLPVLVLGLLLWPLCFFFRCPQCFYLVFQRLLSSLKLKKLTLLFFPGCLPLLNENLLQAEPFTGDFRQLLQGLFFLATLLSAGVNLGLLSIAMICRSLC